MESSSSAIFFTISLLLIFLFVLLWRLLYPWIVNKSIFKERVLIIGTGNLAQKVQKVILENGQDAFEIVGFVGEKGENVGENVESNDHWRLQPDLFHLQRRSN